MAENPSDQPHDVDIVIDKRLKALKHFGFQDESLWEAYHDNFEGFTEEVFKLANNDCLRSLRDHLRQRGVWVQKVPRMAMSKALFNTLREEEPTPWTEAEIRQSMDKEEFVSYHIKELLDTDFGRQPRVYAWQLQPALHLPSAANPSVPSSANVSLSFPPGLSRQLPTGTFPPPPKNSGPLQAPSSGLSQALLPTNPSLPAPPARLRPPILLTPAPPADIRLAPETPELLPATATTISEQPAQSILATTTTTSGHGRELSNLAKMGTDEANEAKYSDENDRHPHLRAHKPNSFPKWLDRWSSHPSWQPTSLRIPISKILYPFFRLSPRCPRHEHLHPLFPNGYNPNLPFSWPRMTRRSTMRPNSCPLLTRKSTLNAAQGLSASTSYPTEFVEDNVGGDGGFFSVVFWGSGGREGDTGGEKEPRVAFTRVEGIGGENECIRSKVLHSFLSAPSV